MTEGAVLAAPWLARRREQALARFRTLGVPRPTDEEWRQTNVQPAAPFLEAVAEEAVVRRDVVDGWPLAASLPHRAVFVNGRFDPEASTLDRLPPGVRIERLLRPAPGVEEHLARVASFETHPFVALNTALFVDGAAITVDSGVTVEAPIHIVHVAAPGPSAAASHPRTLVLAGAGSSVTIVESYLAAGAGAYLTNAVTELVADASAHVEHVKVQTEGEAAWHVATVAGHQSRDSRIVSHNISLGALLARNDIGSRLDGEGAECRLYGLYLADGRQHVDNHTWLDHAKPHCPSWEMYKGVLFGASRAVFNGRIIVRADAQKTDAKQSNRNLLLSDAATVHTRPQLEIHANDVKCTHGATIGRLDEAAMFYLRTRGIAAGDARDLLVRAFADDVLTTIGIPELRAVLADALDRRLARDLHAA